MGVALWSNLINPDWPLLDVQGIHFLRMAIDKSLCLLVLDVNGKPIVMVSAIRVFGVSVLPIHAPGKPFLHRGLLPPTKNLDSRPIVDLAGILQPLVRRHPTVFLVDNGLASLAPGTGMVTNPLVRPFHRFSPPIGVGMENAKVDGVHGQLVVEIPAIRTVIERVIRVVIEPALAPPCHEMVVVQNLYVCADLGNPGGKHLGRAVIAGWEVADCVGSAPGLVAKFPREYGGRILVPGNKLLDVAFECVLDLWHSVELSGC